MSSGRLKMRGARYLIATTSITKTFFTLALIQNYHYPQKCLVSTNGHFKKRSATVKIASQYIIRLGLLGFLSLSGCGADTAAIAVLTAAAAGGVAATTAQINSDDTNEGFSGGSLDDFDGIYHVSAMSADSSLVTCPASFTGWFEADGATREIPRGFFLFMNCETQSLNRIEIDGDFFFEDIDDEVCSRNGCLRLDLTVSSATGQTTRVWRGFLIRGGDGLVFAQVDSFNGSVLAGSGWRTSGGPSLTPNQQNDDLLPPALDETIEGPVDVGA